MHTEVTWQDEMTFDVELDDHHFFIDAAESVGGRDKGPRPKGLVLSGLAGCTGMDVVSILKKMRVDLDGFVIKVKADVTDEHPKVFSKVRIIYEFTGKDLPEDKLEKAVNLSQERYCGVSAMLRKAADLTHEIKVNQS